MATTMKLIAKNVLGSSASSVTFSDIPGTYTDLYLLIAARTPRTDVPDNAKVTFNGITTSTYSWRSIYGNGSSAFSDGESSVAYISAGLVATGSSSTANTFGSGEVYIPNYAGSTAKSVSITGASETNGATAFLGAAAGLWTGTAAITSITLTPFFGANWVSGSSFFLYGITKA